MSQLPVLYTVNGFSLTGLDDFGVQWWTQSVRGWRGTAPRRNDRTARLALDGAHRGYPYRDPRIVVLTGQCKAPSAIERANAERRLGELLDSTRELFPIVRTDEAGFVECVYAELDEVYDPIPYNKYRFQWSLQFAAPDPRKFDYSWITGESGTAIPGTGGIVSTGLGVVSTGLGIVAGTDAKTANVTMTATRSGRSQIVYELIGPGSNLNINQTNKNSVVTFRGELGDGQSVFINTDDQPAYDVPGAGQPIPARAALLNDFNARSAVVVSGDWPTLEPGDVSIFLMSGSASSAASLKVHARGASN